MKVSGFNICSEWLEGLKFSTEMAIENAGNDLDYILILWNPSKEVFDYSTKIILNSNIEKIYIETYKTDESLSFIENLRNCFNMGFDKGFEFNEYTCGINTDMAFNKDWLANLVKYADENSIINCRQIEPNPTMHHEVKDFGEIPNGFNMEDFELYANSISKDKLITEKDWQEIRGNYYVRADATPHLIHKSIWEKVGHWNVKIVGDVDWFNRAKAMGFKNMKSLGSIVYHAGAGETKRRMK